MTDDSYAGDLDGNPLKPSQCASSMAVGLCKDGRTVGFDLYDKDGKTFAHAHLSFERGVDLAEELFELLTTACETEDPAKARPH